VQLIEAPLGDDMCVDHAVRVEKRHDHLLCPADVDPGLQGAWLTPWDPLLALFFHFRRMIGDYGFVHSNNHVQHGRRLAVLSSDELGTDPYPLRY
jgi:hypothetical protein